MTALATALAAAMLAGAAPLHAAAAGKLSWEEMVPEPVLGTGAKSEFAEIPRGPVEALDGRRVRLPGFVVPLESDEGGLLTEFFLVPYFGACIHVPPPPPNQIVYVTVEDAFYLPSMQQPYWIEGVLRAKGHANDVAATVYTMRAERITKYEY